MLSLVISRVILLFAGVVYPAYSSYKCVKGKDVKGYIKWLMYWVVYAIFSSIESVADLFVTWIPFYYEMKILILLWLVSPVSRGFLRFYVGFLHPLLTERENEIDSCLSHVKSLLYFTVVKLFSHIFGMMKYSVSAGHALILEQIKARYGLQEASGNSGKENDDTVEAAGELSVANDNESKAETIPTVEDNDSQLDSKDTVPLTTVATDTEVPATSATKSVATLSGSSTSPLDSKSNLHRKPLPLNDLSYYDRYTRLSYASHSSSSSSHSSYPSASTGSSLGHTGSSALSSRVHSGSSLYDRYTKPTLSSSSRYSSSTWSPKTSTYSTRYSKR